MMVYAPGGVTPTENDAIYLANTRVGSRDTYQELAKHHGFKLVGRRHWDMKDCLQQERALTGVRDWPYDQGEKPFEGHRWWHDIGGYRREWKFFCAVRHPKTFLVRWWCHDVLMQTEEFRPIEFWWIQILQERAPWHFRHPNQLFRFLYDPGCWRVMRWETLQEDLPVVLRALGVDWTLYHLNKPNPRTRTGNQPDDDLSDDCWEPDALAFFYDTYGPEMEMLGYE